jgi:signal transduction histidine kinase
MHLAVLADEKDQSITVEHVGAARCRGDAVALRQALLNLVDNAIKYSPDGTTIELRVAATTGGASIEVCDRGPGIAPERSAGLFERFYRASADTAASGMGLGLSISRWAVEACHGQIVCEQRAGGGSTFRITLPVEEVRS